MELTTSSTSAAITAPPASIEPPGLKPSRAGPRSPAWPLGHKPSCTRPSCAASRPEPIKLTVPSDLFILRGVPGHIRSDNGPEFVAKVVQDWITAVGAKTAYIAPGSPWENGSVESFNARLRDELLDGESFYTLQEAKVVIESWRRHYNTVRPHASLGYKPPAPEVFVSAFAAWPAPLAQPAPPDRLPVAQRPTLN